MSVTTSSDTYRAEAKDKIKNAIQILNGAYDDLRKATDEDTWGSNDYKTEYSEFLLDAQLQIVDVTNTIKKIHQKI